MPVIDSFRVDHTQMKAPAVREAKIMKTPKGDKITVYDLRFTVPNKKKMKAKGVHTLEHLFAGFMRENLKALNDAEVIDISPMGCRTGFYMSVVGDCDVYDIQDAWWESMEDVLRVESEKDIPELNKYQCGSYKMHSLKQAKKIAKRVLKQGISKMDNNKLMLKDV